MVSLSSALELIPALASGLIMDTSSAFAVPTLGTRKTEPKSRYSLVLHAAEAFESELDHSQSMLPCSR
jgi:hypothetical protein